MNQYRGEDVIVGNDNSQNASIPTGFPLSCWIFAEGGVVYYTINGDAAPTTSGGYVADGGARYIGPYTNITSLGIYAATGTTAHIIFDT